MLTNRGRWLLVFAVGGTGVGLFRGQEMLSLTSLAVLVWLFVEWVLFRWRVELQFRQLHCERIVNGSKSETRTLWAERPLQVSVHVSAGPRMRIPFVRLEDFLPDNIELVDGRNVIDATISGGGPIEFRYVGRPRGAGAASLPGVCARICDLQGLFFAQRFLPVRQSFRILPTCVDVDLARPTIKRVNVLPPAGIHRLQRSGMGSELLELREYVPGDPPKSIAWKVSARRDCLMTREYESEVPVRTILFVDSSYGAQIGAFGDRPLDKFVLLATSIARSAMSHRDPVGLVLFDDSRSRSLDSGRGDRQFYRILNELTDCATPTEPPPCRLTRELLDSAWTVCTDHHPELLDSRVNRLPFTWFPILPERRRQRNRRAKMAAVFTEIYNLAPDAPVRLLYDDVMMATCIQRFLTDAGFAWMQPVIDRRGRELHDWHGKFDTLSTALTSAIARGRDNELYVLLVDLIDSVGPLDRLANAIRVARARHHRVAVICPWPGMKEGAATSRGVTGLLEHADELRLKAAADELKRKLRRLGASVAVAADSRALQLVLSEAELARNGRATTGRTR